MLANTLVVNGVTLLRVREGEFSSEYRKVTSTQEYRLHFRHTNVKPLSNGKVRDRHNVELVVTTFATPTAPEEVQKAYIVIEQSNDNTDSSVSANLMAVLGANELALLSSVHAWDS